MGEGYFGEGHFKKFNARQIAEREPILNGDSQYPSIAIGEFPDVSDAPSTQKLTFRVDKKGRQMVIDHLAGNKPDPLPKVKEPKIKSGETVAKTKSQPTGIKAAIENWAQGLEPEKAKRITVVLNAAGIALAISTMSPEETAFPQPTIEASAASIVISENAIPTPEIKAPEFFCNADAPAIWEHKDKAVLLTENRACERLSQAMPEIKETVEYTSQIAVTGLESGGYYFRITGKTPVGVTQDKWTSFIDGWILTGGKAQNFFPFPDFMAQYFQESKLGYYDKAMGGNACGAGQIMPDTYPELVRKYGADHGLTEESEEIKAIKHRTRDDLKTARSGTAREIFRDTCKDTTISVALSTRKNLTDAKNLQAIVKTGKLELPGGRDYIIGADVYLTHLHGPGAINFDKNGKFLNANGAAEVLYYLGHQPNRLMSDIVPRAPRDQYKANINFFTKLVPGQGRQSLTVTEYYNKLRAENAFSQRRLPDLSNWQMPEFAADGQHDAQDFAERFNTKAVNDDNAPTYKMNVTLPVLDMDGQPVMGKDNKPLTAQFNGIHGFRLHAVPAQGEEPKAFLDDPGSYLKEAFMNTFFGEKSAPAYRAIIKYEQPTSVQGYMVPRIVAAQHI